MSTSLSNGARLPKRSSPARLIATKRRRKIAMDAASNSKTARKKAQVAAASPDAADDKAFFDAVSVIDFGHVDDRSTIDTIYKIPHIHRRRP